MGVPAKLDEYAHRLRRPCCAAFGFGGRITVCRTRATPSGPEGCAIASPVRVYSTREMLLAADEGEAVAMHSYPGPLVHGDCPDEAVVKWIRKSLLEPAAGASAACRHRVTGTLGIARSTPASAALHACLEGLLLIGPTRFAAALEAAGT